MLIANDCKENLAIQVIINFMRYPGFIIPDIEHRRGIDTTYVVPIRGVILDEKIPKLKYDGPILVDKWERLAKESCNCLMRHIHNMPVCHKYTISRLDFGYSIVLEFYNRKIEDVLAHDLVDLTLARKVLKYVLVGLIILHTEVIFHGDIKPQSIAKCGSSWKLTGLNSSRKIGDASRNEERYTWGYCPPEVVVTLPN